jgi:hypothetical protein
MVVQVSANPKSTKNPLMMLIFGLIILVAIAFGLSYHYYSEYTLIKNNPDMIYKDENNRLLEEVGKLMELPTDEEPTIATVMDKELLKDQAFFTKAENGDKLIVYIGSKKAILYRPSIKKIVDFAPIIMDNNAGIQPQTDIPTIIEDVDVNMDMQTEENISETEV